MPTDITSSSLTATIPALGDAANIVTAFTSYHSDIAAGVAVLGRTNTFTQASTFSAPVTMSTSTATLVFNDGTNIEGRMLASSGVFYIQAGSSNADTSAQLNIARNGTTSTNISALNLYANDITLGGSLNLVAGTSSVEPLKFSLGTNVTTLVAGAVEYDGSLFYATPKVNATGVGRGMVPSQYLLLTTSNNTQTVTGTSNTDFYALNKSVYLAASQAYFVEMSVRVAHTLTYTGLGSGSATFLLKGPSGVSYKVDAQSQVDMAALDSTNAPEFKHISSSSASRTISSPGGASDSGYSIFKWSGVVYVSSTAGNFGPAINLTSSSSYSSSFTVQAGSYCKVTPIGPYASEINIGGWA
jgi:hypothetical protein